MKAYSYIRWSSDIQTEGDSLSRQLNSTRAVCKRNGWDLDETTIGHDVGTSAFRGKNLKSGNLATFIQSVESKRIQTPCVLVIDDMSRLTRLPFKQARRHFEDILDLGVSICTADDNKVYKESSMDSLFGLLEPLMKIEAAGKHSAELSRKLLAAWETRQQEIQQGKDRFGKLPFWLFRDKSTNQIKVNTEAAKVVQKIFELYNSGLGVRAIAERLNLDKIPIFRGRKDGRTQWQTSSVQFVLKSPTVYGAFQNYKIRDGKRSKVGELIENVLPVIIPKAYFKLTEDKSTKRQKFKGRFDSSSVPNLFSGIIKCKHCGGSMIVCRSGGNASSYLICSHYHFSKTCQRGGINYKAVERVVSVFVCHAPNEYGAFLNYTGTDNFDGELQNKKAELVSIKNGIKRLIKLHAVTESENVIEELNEMEKKQNKLLQDITEVEANMRSSEQSPAEFEELRNLFVNGEKSRLIIREKFRGIIKQIICDVSKQSLTIVWNSLRKPDQLQLRSKFNGNKPSSWEYKTGGTWYNAGSLPKNNEEATQFIILLMNQQKVMA